MEREHQQQHSPPRPENSRPSSDDEMLPLELKVEEIAGFALLVLFSIDKKHNRYLIGVEMARILKQQTYNMYRSLKSKGIHLIRANQHCLSFLRDKKAVPRNTHSVTLVPYADGVRFILTKLREKQRIEMESKAVGLLSSTPSNPSNLYQISSPAKPKPDTTTTLPSIFSFSPSFSRTGEPAPAHQGFPVNRFQLFNQPHPTAPRQNLHRPFPVPDDPQMHGDFSTLFSLACLSEIEAKKLSQKAALENKPAPLEKTTTTTTTTTTPQEKDCGTTKFVPAREEKKQGPTKIEASAEVVATPSSTEQQPILTKGWIQLLLNSASPVS